MSNKHQHWQFLIDTGGTFTDCLAYDPQGGLHRTKVLSKSALRGKITAWIAANQFKFIANWDTDADIFGGYHLKVLQQEHEAVFVDRINFKEGTITVTHVPAVNLLPGSEFEITAYEEAPVLAARLITKTPLDQQLPPMEMRLGSTRGTNALLEKKGAGFGFITTKGFEDLIKIGTQQRPDIFALRVDRHPPLYKNVYSLEQRMDKAGNVLCAPAHDAIQSLIAQLQADNIHNVAIAFLHSYVNPEHEYQLCDALQKAGIRYISCSADMASSIRIVPRATTANVNAYLSPVIYEYLDAVRTKLSDGSIKVMTSAGGLVDAGLFQPKDSLLSGPAGGVVGAVAVAEKTGFEKILTLDMGGTSTDVARYDGDFDYRFESQIAGINIFSPSLAIETVAAGGGSVCSYDGIKFSVGPESAGAHPGPASYGSGGPLSLTDINLLLGRLHPSNFSIPLNKELAKEAFAYIRKDYPAREEEKLLSGFLDIANEKMAAAIRKISLRQGYDPSQYALLAFGGAGGQHACNVAVLLNISHVIIPYEAGLLSAYGMGQALTERFAERQVLRLIDDPALDLPALISTLQQNAFGQLKKEGFADQDLKTRRISLFMRFSGQDQALEVAYEPGIDIRAAFRQVYESTFGHWLEDRAVELESVKVVASDQMPEAPVDKQVDSVYKPEQTGATEAFTGEMWQKVPVYSWEALQAGAVFEGPALLTSRYSTVWLETGWELMINRHNTAVLTRQDKAGDHAANAKPEAIRLELFTNRFRGIAGEMGALLERTSFSVNIKERLDFSCALLDAEGRLVANAPHIPVHLGSLGICTRSVCRALPLQEGDVAVTNHPRYGGSHLPDITLVAPVYAGDHTLLGYVANRAHHAELGGKRPGSMPPDARNLAEEGVVIEPVYLVKGGVVQWQTMHDILTSHQYPSRSPAENLADLKAALASVNAGRGALKALAAGAGTDEVKKYMNLLRHYAARRFYKRLHQFTPGVRRAVEYLDDGSRICVNITVNTSRIKIDFTGTAAEHSGNLNANPAIVNSAVIYVIRLLLEEDIPLNEGLMYAVELVLPEKTIVNPDFSKAGDQCPAVVGGNTETSQRIVDTLLKALEVMGCSQGTMNNLLFGNDKFGYYETIGGGTGAGYGFHGTDAVHHHMTNTRITDPEVFELRYPVNLDEFSIRQGSGGTGKWHGGNGIVRKITFLEDVELTILSQHRHEAPYGIKGGDAGKTGRQWIIRKNKQTEPLNGIDGKTLRHGDSIVIETPGGGAYGVENL